MTERASGPPGPKDDDDIDVLLRSTLRDDLPAEVEARLERRIQQFVATRTKAAHEPASAFPWFVPAPGQRVMAIVASLLLACGFGLQASSGPDELAQSLSDVSATVALARAVRGALSMRCAGVEDHALDSPAALADRIYRRWVLLRSRARPDTTVVYEFLAPDESAVYELVSGGPSQPPREVRKRALAGAAPEAEARPPEIATCTWEVPPPGTRGIAFMFGG